MTTTTKDAEGCAVGPGLLTMTYRQVDKNPDMENSGDMTHWRCALRFQGRRMQIVFSKGPAHQGRPPRIGEVLDCLRMDAMGYENARGFDDWCSEYGYDTDSRKAERIYHAVGRQVARLRELFGSHFADFLDMEDSDSC